MLGGAVYALAHDPHSLTARAMGGDGHTLTEHLLYLLLDELRISNWQRSKDGQKGRHKPKRTSPLAEKPKRIGSVDEERSDADVAALLARYGPQASTVMDAAAPDVDAPTDIAGDAGDGGTVGGHRIQS